MASMTEGSFLASDGHLLYRKEWTAQKNREVARLLWLHGFGDHCSNYDDVFILLANQGITVHAFDQRGQGRSINGPSDKGRTGPAETILSDVTDFIRALPATGVAQFLGGHSMGGAEVLLWASRAPADVKASIRGYLVEAPMLRLHPSLQPSNSIVWAMRALAKIVPNWQIVQSPSADRVSRDKRVQEKVAKQDAAVATLSSIVNTFLWTGELDQGLCDLSARETASKGLWIGHGDEDRVTSFDAARDYYARSGVKDKTFVTYTGCLHVIHQEPDPEKNRLVQDMASWISSRAV